MSSTAMPGPNKATTTTSTTATTLTLIVATTPVTHRAHGSSNTLLGIGRNGTLPWPRIKSDMSFFARVTTRPPLSPPPAGGGGGGGNKLNAIIMGRKTYYSLPKALRPLKERLNVVISRDENGGVAEEVRRDLARQREKKYGNNNETTTTTATTGGSGDNNGSSNNNSEGKDGLKVSQELDKRDAFVSHNLENAIDQLVVRQGEEGGADVGHIFVIGGGEIYNSALKLGTSLHGQGGEGDDNKKKNVLLRILMTRVKKTKEGEEFDCDTFFPLTDDDLRKAWREAGADELESWIGERVPADWVEEGEVATKIVGYERTV